MADPVEWLRGYLRQWRNHLPRIDAMVEETAAELPDDPAERRTAMRERLRECWAITTAVVPDAALPEALRHYDPQRRRLTLAEALDTSGRQFAIAYQLCLFELDPLLGELLEQARPPHPAARLLLKIAMTNYAAAALLMPYERFRSTAEESRHDMGLLRARFGVSFEQAAHRLTTLGRDGAAGLPFFLVAFDEAGQIAKRVLGEAYPFAPRGGLCPRWNGYAALRGGDTPVAELIETPAGERFVTIAQPATRRGRAYRAVAIGCDARHAGRIVHCAGLTVATKIGPSCGLCAREACPDRTMPPIDRAPALDQFRRPRAPWPFSRP